MKRKAIVFGGSGFVGSHVADALTQAGFDVTIFDLHTSAYLSANQKFIKGDILNQSAVEDATENMDYVFHFAGQPNILASFKEPAKTLYLNIQGTVNILEACVKHNVQRVLFASTVYVYSDAGGFYKVSKQSCEIIIQEYQKNFNLNYTILKYGSLYGQRANDTNFIYRLLKQATLEKTIDVDFEYDDQREYIHVLDAAKMSIIALDNEYVNTSVMLTGYRYVSCKELLDLINDILGGNIQYRQINKRNEHSMKHYNKTPYVFRPNVSKKIMARDYIEFGQGILVSIEEIYDHFVRNKEKIGSIPE